MCCEEGRLPGVSRAQLSQPTAESKGEEGKERRHPSPRVRPSVCLSTAASNLQAGRKHGPAVNDCWLQAGHPP